jgi:hypothetical protein
MSKMYRIRGDVADNGDIEEVEAIYKGKGYMVRVFWPDGNSYLDEHDGNDVHYFDTWQEARDFQVKREEERDYKSFKFFFFAYADDENGNGFTYQWDTNVMYIAMIIRNSINPFWIELNSHSWDGLWEKMYRGDEQ